MLVFYLQHRSGRSITYDLNKEYYVDGSFQLHQVCEKYYNPKTHDLKKLLKRIKKYSRDLLIVFPLNTDFEKCCYDLLWRAYIETRYNPDFVVTKEEYEYIIGQIEILKSITESICTEKIASFDSKIETE